MKEKVLRLGKTLTALLLTFCLAACSAPAEGTNPADTAAETATQEAAQESGLYVPGTYTASAAGLKGDVTVEVVFSADAIDSVTVTDHTETDGIGTNAVDIIPGEIVESQSLGVDAVSGATVTSNAILEAVADCVTQAEMRRH